MSVAASPSDERLDGSWSGAAGPASDGSVRLPQVALASIGRALQNIFERYSGKAMRRIVGVSDEYGIDGLYVSFIVIRERTAWPAMRSEDRVALELTSRLLDGFAMMPSTSYMQVPPADVDVFVDRILGQVAHWARQKLSADLKREYMALLEEYAERLRPMIEAQRGGSIEDALVDRPAITIALMEAFETWLAERGGGPERRAMHVILDGLFR